MCRSKAEGGRRCPEGSSHSGHGGGSVPAAHRGDRPSRRVDGKPETEADRRFFDLRESGYKGPIDQDGNATSEADTRRSPRERAEDHALTDMKDEMRKWRSFPTPEPGPAEPMSPAKAKLLGCDTPEGRAKFDRLRAYREAGYSGPLDRNNNIPDPDDPAEQRSLDALAALSLTHS